MRDIKRKIEVSPDLDYGVHVFAVAISKDRFANEPLFIPTAPGDPISNEIHDIVRDRYYCHGISFLDIGEVPVGFRISMADALGWEEDVPLPCSVIKRHMSPDQKRAFDRWKRNYDGHCEIKFLQVKCVF